MALKFTPGDRQLNKLTLFRSMAAPAPPCVRNEYCPTKKEPNTKEIDYARLNVLASQFAVSVEQETTPANLNAWEEALEEILEQSSSLSPR
ncbi:hypothetical protein ACLJYM_10735 [Rhizobium giardinii]|uniref:hypothetical protein n=1 Tax=Rhizobium giardinii TaxID=56731 RepID=UPI0039E0A337